MSEQGGPSVTWRIVVSIVSTVVWFVFMLFWVGFIWDSFEAAQNVVVLCISGVVFTGINALVWTIWPRKRE